jgi:hypothetical protein
VTADNSKEAGNTDLETNKSISSGSGGVVSLVYLPPAAGCAATVEDCLEPVFVHRDPNTLSQDTNITVQDLADAVNYTIDETLKASPEAIKERSDSRRIKTKNGAKSFRKLVLVGCSGSQIGSSKNMGVGVSSEASENAICPIADLVSNTAIELALEPVAPRIYFPLSPIPFCADLEHREAQIGSVGISHQDPKMASSALGNVSLLNQELQGNYHKPLLVVDSTIGITTFILPYGSQRRPKQKNEVLGSDSVPLRWLLCEQEKSKNKGPPKFDK